MKQLTIIGLLFLSIVATLTSCNQTDVSPADDLSAFSDFSFLATTDDSTGTRKPHDGKCNVTEMDIASLPAAVTDYITATYAGSTVERAGTLTDGSYVVKITKADGTEAGLKFDSAGAFVAEHTGKAPHTHIAVADLPSAITDYITANYAGSTIAKAATTTDGSYIALVKKADGTMVGVGFDSAGAFTGEMTMTGKGRKGGKGGH